MHRRFVLLAALLLCGVVGPGDWASPALGQLESLSGRIPGAGAADSQESAKLALKAVIEPAEGNRPAKLVIAAQIAPHWHIYSITQAPGGPIRSKIKLPPSNDYRLLGDFTASPAAEVHEYGDVWPGLKVEEHSGKVTWQAPVELAAGVDPAKLEIAGAVYAQICADSCLPPRDYKFVAKLAPGGAAPAGTASALAPARAIPASNVAPTRPAIPDQAVAAPAGESAAAQPAASHQYEVVDLNGVRATSLPMVLVFSFLGGLILNVMPCVLPVIGLKILSFVEQGGHSARRILMLNLIYSAGMMAVFLVLATLAVTLKLGWGEHFNSVPFTITLTALVFAMALSFLGIWEIPIPGFVGSGAAAQAAAREGAAGAFAKGVVTTVLATPCSGPYLGTVFGFTVGQPPVVTYLVFATIGLGMASPYLVIGAFPRLVRFLPKPGAWMDTFKQFMGFVLLGTVVFLFSTLNRDYLVPTFALFIGIWAACWWIGRMPFTLSRGRRLLGWLEGAVVTAIVGSFAFTWLVPQPNVLAWQPFSRTALDQLTGQGKTVLVDFTASWCATCRVNLQTAIETEAVRKLVETNGVVPLLADWSNYDPSDEIGTILNDLTKAKFIPVLAIFPAGQPNKVYVLREIISQRQLLDALAKAGPSRTSGAQASAVDPLGIAEPGGTRR